MIKKITLILLFGFNIIAFSQQTTLQVVGKNLTLTNGQNIILRGVNYTFIDETIDMTNPASYQYYINEASKTGANSFRITWYTDGAHWRDGTQFGAPGTMNSYVNNNHLNNAVAYCISKGMIPILSIHDLMCSNDWNYFNNNYMNFWKSPIIQTLIQNNKSKIIINLANEFGKVRWGSNPVTDLQVYKNNYNAAIASLRALNINVPIMIDAPDCAQSTTEMLSVAESMNMSDTRNNLIFSAHAYWGNYADTQTQIIAKLNEAQNTNVCYVIGELASRQDVTACGSLDLTPIYPIILQEACSRNIGWLAWTFNQDCNSNRNMATNGNFNNLTTFGNDIVYNVNYGLKSTSGCGAATLSNNAFDLNSKTIAIYPNPNSGKFSIKTEEKITKVTCVDILGKAIELLNLDNNLFTILNPAKGVYILKIELDNNLVSYRKIILD